jgi:hypothetical protein
MSGQAKIPRPASMQNSKLCLNESDSSDLATAIVPMDIKDMVNRLRRTRANKARSRQASACAVETPIDERDWPVSRLSGNLRRIG